jgi:hypothetical protein
MSAHIIEDGERDASSVCYRREVNNK